MDIQFMLVEDERKMEIYNNGYLLTDYPLHPSEVNRLKQAGVIDDIRKHLVTQICGENFMHIIHNVVDIAERNNNEDTSDMFYEFPHEN
jgi:hypothetical protein